MIDDFLTLPGRGRLAMRTWHAEAPGEPILATHGWLDNAATFDLLAPLLPGRPLIAVDLPGHGLSDPRPGGMRYHTLDYLDDLFAVMDRLSPDRPLTLLGHSLGAGLSLLLAGCLPERVDRLVLIDGLGPLAAEPERFPELTRQALESFRDQSGARRPVVSLEVAVQARRNGMTGPLSEQAARRLCERSLEQVEDGQLYWRSDKRLRLPSLTRFSEAQVRAAIASVTAPVLCIHGDRGLPALSPGYLERLQGFRQVQVETLPGGHHLHLDDCPAQVAELISVFLSSAKP